MYLLVIVESIWTLALEDVLVALIYQFGPVSD